MTAIYGLIGKKLGHSFSARYFNDRFRRENTDAEYKLFEIPSVEGISNIIISERGLKGLNVTIPYKRDVIPLLDTITYEARAIGAVNTVRIERNGSDIYLHGHNTDAGGFRKAIEPLIEGRDKALLLGSGGASKAVAYVLHNLGIGITQVSRHKGDGVIPYSELNDDIMSRHQIIVNCTPLGMWPDVDSAPDIPYDSIDSKHLCFDLVYNPEVTEFLRRSASRGAVTCNGLSMLYNQADLAYDFWNA